MQGHGIGERWRGHHRAFDMSVSVDHAGDQHLTFGIEAHETLITFPNASDPAAVYGYVGCFIFEREDVCDFCVLDHEVGFNVPASYGS